MDKRQLDLPLLFTPRPDRGVVPAPREPAAPRRLSVIRGEGKPKPLQLRSRDDLARVLVGAAGDMLLRRITPTRAHAIQAKVDRLMALFDRVDREPLLGAVLRRELDDLEELVRDGAKARRR